MNSALIVDTSLATTPIISNHINVLILDDNQFDRIRIRRMFESTGVNFHLCEVANLDVLDENLSRMKFDIILIDFLLPEGDGIEALKQIQNHSNNHDVATVMIAGDDQSQVAVRAMKNGCQDYIAKETLNSHRLLELIISVIGGAGIAPTKVTAVREGLEEVVSCLREQNDSVLKPKITKIIQDIRSLRTRTYQPHSPLAHELATIENGCLGLWSSLLEADAIALTKPEYFKPG